MSPTVLHPDGIDPVEMLPGAFRRTLHTGERLQIVHITLRPGAGVPMHHHPHEQTGTVLKGELQMTIGGEVHQLRPGDSYLIPGGVEHDARAGSTEVAVIDVFCPPREEYR